eukprot:TRINITY_DN7103_c0_g1_i4.p1 TRINITY_DN7103_c0_g1~~TRINITY_DN7103_c0_g1_i4.p1  ORF type:complete len:201 (-),score=53.29 TRINITY_DN7103_c0_g1_i4:94-696(-)
MRDRVPEILEDMARDNIILKENRWPYVGTRAPVPSSQKSRTIKSRGPLYPEGLCSKKTAAEPKPKALNTETKAARLRREAAEKMIKAREQQAAAREQEQQDVLAKQREVNLRFSKTLKAAKKGTDNRNKARQASRARQTREATEFARQEKAEREAKLAAMAPVWERTRDDQMRQRVQDDIDEAMMSTGADMLMDGTSGWK